MLKSFISWYDELFFKGASFWIDGLALIHTSVNEVIFYVAWNSHKDPYYAGQSFHNALDYPDNLSIAVFSFMLVSPNYFILLRDKICLLTMQVGYDPLTSKFFIFLAFGLHLLVTQFFIDTIYTG